MSIESPTVSECSMNTSMSSMSYEIDNETRELCRNFKIMSKDELSALIDKFKGMIEKTEEKSTQKMWQIRKLVELRFHLAHINALRENVESEDNTTIAGHNFKILKQVSSKRIFCDRCTNPIIWIFQPSYSCLDCSFVVHAKCLKYVTRICAHVIVCEKGRPEVRICPEIGLYMQLYKCAECKIQLMNKNCYLEPRKCHYSGLFYCKICHWNNYSIIPGNIIHNWDFEQRLVSRQSLQEINLFYERPVVKLEEINSKLFIFHQKLANVKQKRINLMEMKRYLDVCKFALTTKLVDNTMGVRRHLVQSTDFFSIYDLVCVENSSMNDYLNVTYSIFKGHIANCDICGGQGFICEFCGNPEPIYPFNEGIFKCEACSACFHRPCFMMSAIRKCPRCERSKAKRELYSEMP